MTRIKRPKIERAINELWLPPFLQRKPAQPPNFKRFMGHYPCDDCCGEVACPICPSSVSSYTVDLTGFTLVDSFCDFCDEVSDTFVLDFVLEDTDCVWLFCLPEACEQVSFPFAVHRFVVKLLLVKSIPLDESYFRLFVGFTPGDSCSPSALEFDTVYRYESVRWTTSTGNCSEIFDGEGKFTVSFDSHIVGSECAFGGTFPATIDVEVV